MTVSNSVGYVEYVGTGVITLFPIPFPFLDFASHIHVYDYTSGIPSKTEYTQGTDYSVIGIGSNPQVEFVVAPAVGVKILVRREIPITQLADYLPTGVFPAETHEDALDKLTMICQDLLSRIELGDFDFGAFMTIGEDGCWDAQGLSICNGSPATDGDEFTTLSQVYAIITGTTVVPISGLNPWLFLGDGVTTTFPLAGAFDYDADDIIVSLNGLEQIAGSLESYTLTNSGDSTIPDAIEFSTAPANGVKIYARIPTGTALVDASSFVISGANIPDGQIPLSKLEAGNEGQVVIYNASGVAIGDNLTAADVSDFTAAVQALPVNTLSPATGPLIMNGQKVTGMAAGTASGDAVNKAQLDALTPFSRQTGTVSWATGAGSWTAIIDFPFSVGLLNLYFTGTVGGGGVANGASFTFHGNGTSVHSTAAGLSISAVRTTLPGGTRISLATNIGTGSGTSLVGVGNNPYFGAQGNA